MNDFDWFHAFVIVMVCFVLIAIMYEFRRTADSFGRRRKNRNALRAPDKSCMRDWKGEFKGALKR